MSFKTWIKKIFANNQTVEKEPEIESSVNKHQKYYLNPNVFTLSQYGYAVPDSAKMNDILESDAHFYACFSTLWEKVLSLDWEISPFLKSPDKDVRGKDRKAYEFILKSFEKIPLNIIQKQMLHAQIGGKEVFELKYKTLPNGNPDLTSGYYELEAIEQLNPDFFDFSYPDGNLIYRSNKNWGTEINITKDYPNQFIVHTNDSSPVNPHGNSVIGKRGAILYNLKRGFIDGYAINNEIFSNPSLWIKYLKFSDKGEIILDDDNEKRLVDSIKNNIITPMKTQGRNAKILSPNNVDIKYLHPDMKQLLSLQDAWEMINREISKLILGSTKVNEGTERTGSLSQSEIHEETTEAKVEKVAKDLEITFNKIIKILCDLNFEGLQGYPYFKINYKRNVVDMEEYNRIMGFVEKLGLPVSKEWIYTKYNITPPMNEEDRLGGSPLIEEETVIEEPVSDSDDETIEDEENNDNNEETENNDE